MRHSPQTRRSSRAYLMRKISCALISQNISRPAGCDGGARGSGACALRDVCRKAANSPRTVTSAPPPPFEKGRRKLFVQYFLQNDFFDRLRRKLYFLLRMAGDCSDASPYSRRRNRALFGPAQLIRTRRTAAQPPAKSSKINRPYTPPGHRTAAGRACPPAGCPAPNAAPRRPCKQSNSRAKAPSAG